MIYTGGATYGRVLGTLTVLVNTVRAQINTLSLWCVFGAPSRRIEAGRIPEILTDCLFSFTGYVK